MEREVVVLRTEAQLYTGCEQSDRASAGGCSPIGCGDEHGGFSALAFHGEGEASER